MKRKPPETPELRQILGRNIKLYRARRGLSQRDLAALASTTQSRVAGIELGNTSTTIDLLERIAAGLQVNPWRLLHPDESN